MKAPNAGLGFSSISILVFLLSIFGQMEEDSGSWVTRAKFSPTVYLRSASVGLSSSANDYKSDRLFDLEEKTLISESKSFEPLQLRSVTPVSVSQKNSPDLESPVVNFTAKTDPESNNFSSDSLSFKSSLQHGSSLTSLHALKDSDSQTADFSFYPDVITSSNLMEDSNCGSSDTCSLKSVSKLGHSQSVPPLATKSISQTVDFSFNNYRSISKLLPHEDSFSCKWFPQHGYSQPLIPMPTDSNLVSSDSFSCKWFPQHGFSQSLLPTPTDSNLVSSESFSCKWFPKHGYSQPLLPMSADPDVSTSKTMPLKNSLDSFTNKASLLHRRSQSLNPIAKVSNSQPVNFSFQYDVSTNSDPKNLDSCTPCFVSSMKKTDHKLPYSCLFPDQKERKSKPKLRSVSPLPRSILYDAFKEAKCISKRFSTPPPHRVEPEKNNTVEHCSSHDCNPLEHIASGKSFNKSRAKKDTHKVSALENTQNWVVDLSELYFGARFAAGAHSRLYHGIYKNQPVAVKIIRLPNDDDDENGVMAARLEKQFTRETAFLSHLCHHNVIKLAGACKSSPIFFIITEYLSGGSLRSFLHKLDHSPLPLDKLISIALDVSRGMEYIHSQGIIHRDLKPENILFDHNYCVKIADFGVACEEAYCDALEDDAGTYRWMAPEMIKHKPYGRKVDVYSFGLLLWEMISGAMPYEDMTPVQAAFAVVNKNLRPIIPVDSPVVLRVLIEQCWSTLPEKRPEFWQIVKVLEQFESDLVHCGTLRQLQNLTFQDHKKRLLKWVEKLKPPKVQVFMPTIPKTL